MIVITLFISTANWLSSVQEIPTESKNHKSHTFEVHDVIKSDKVLAAVSKPAQVVHERCGSVIPEAFSAFSHTPFESVENYEPMANAFITAVHTAFSHHYPLVLSPDAIWLCIMQGVSIHINSNSEKLRSHFVEFEGKKDLKVFTFLPFVKGSPSNPWPQILELFSTGINQHIGDKAHTLLTPQFTTTGTVERAASQIVLMDCFKEYFSYQMTCLCGIPSITLTGTADDWKQLRDRALSLKQYELDWWIDELEPVLDQFVDAASGNVDRDFWASIYKLEHAYGDELVNGWILTLFPYLKRSEKNKSLSSWRDDTYKQKPDPVRGDLMTSHSATVSTDSFPLGVASVPFEWVSADNVKYPMQFFAGFMAATQDRNTLAIYPEIGWAVADRNEVDFSNKMLKKHGYGW